MLQMFLLAAFLVSTSLFSAPEEFPQVVDFGKMRSFGGLLEADSNAELWAKNLGDSARDLGLIAFNESPEIGVFIYALKREHCVDIAIETGTYTGSTTLYLSRFFDKVHTIEISDELYQKGSVLFQKYPNVHRHHGSSEDVLKKILPSLEGKRILFYLDAHWGAYWPLLDELKEISKTHKDNCIIVVDDFKVPGRDDIAYDSYNEMECSYEYIKDGLEQVFTEYTFCYVIPKDLGHRAKFVAMPKNWK